ncbi:penicillin-binding transpeptidase domain-containing protein [Streptosporangium carneum]|uniref:Penicillin-binding protein n=1 Tax=Streptosporangium carneum TaxID=47481 RepID=A0A9W6MCD3_9ACTN|nr:penicillin-binding transpeptidase domain-containing protein [Streptosporangium carneum]GLK09056.1 penicillin-binding protein [Streptosporangium carneum]
MRSRRLLMLIALALAVTAFGVYGVLSVTGETTTSPPRRDVSGETAGRSSDPEPESTTALAQVAPTASAAPTLLLSPVPSQPPAQASPSPTAQDGPEAVAARYFAAWQIGDLTSMAGLVSAPPADFAERHRRFDTELRTSSPSLVPGPLRRQNALEAQVPFQGTREVAGLGRWSFSSALRLALRGGRWKVLWTPQTLHPSLRDGVSLRLRESRVRRPATLTLEGLPFPRDSRADEYFGGLDGTTVELAVQEVPSGRVLLASPSRRTAGTRTTISQPVQAAAARALDGLSQPAAVVVVDVRTRQVRAVADTLGGKQAFIGLYPPGSTFKVVTAAALLRSGLTAQSPVPCPASYTIPNARTFTDDDRTDHGAVPLVTAFALSCNTTFVQQTYERLREGGLRAEAADRFGFREKPGLSYCRIKPHNDLNELGSDSIGQNSVQASPLCMAEVAAAVAGGVWKPAVMTAEPSADSPPPVPLDDGVAEGLRTMMSAVVTQGTAARAGLPPDTMGKTGTAEVVGGRPHAWFIGYRGSLAFAVFVQNGGSGGAVAAPIAARFLKAL